MKEPIHASAHVSFVGLAALAIGFADAALIAASKIGAAGAFQYVPPRLWFVVPLCWIVVAFVLALPSYALLRRRGATLTVMALVALFLFSRFHHARLRWLAAAVAAMIVAGVVVWFVGRRWMAAPKRIVATLLAVAMVALLAGAVIGSHPAQLPRRSPAAQRAAPDVILVFLDTVSYDAIFPRGTAVDPRLRFLSRLASRGIVFDRAYTPAPWTLPAHVSAVTGIPAHRLGIGFDHQRYEGTGLTLAERFRRRGYRTAAVISNTFLNRGTGFARGFETFEHAANALDVCRTAPGQLLDRWWPWFAASVCNWNAGEVTRRAIAHVKAGNARPLFLLLNYMDAHDPYYVERGCDRPSGVNPLPLEVAPGEYRRRYYASHLAAIRCIDQRLGELATQLEHRNRGIVLAVLADHGEQFGEHGLVRHGNSVFDRLLHVPLMIAAPSVAPRHVPALVSIEMLPQIVMSIVDGGEGAPPERPIVASLVLPASAGGNEQWSLIRGSWHLITSGNEVQLYDLSTDIPEQRNLASGAAASLVRQLSADLARESRLRVDPRSKEFRSLGYIR